MTTATVRLPLSNPSLPKKRTGLRVAVVDEEMPYPLNSGKRIRTLNLLKRLASRHQITYICHRNADAKEARQAEQHLRECGIKPVIVQRSVPRKSGIGFYARLAVNLFSSLPYSVVTHTSAGLRREISELASRCAIDVWHCEWTPYAESLRALPDARWLVVAHNVESLIWQRYHETEKHPLKRWFIRGQWRKFERFEKWALNAASYAVAVSPEDATRMHDDFQAQRVEVVDNGVDTSYFRPSRQARVPGQILFLGSLDWRPNQDAVRLLLDRIFPEVRKRESNARLCIVGRNPPEWLRRESYQHPAVELHADPPDVRPYLNCSAVMAVPLRIGGGSRLKILESLTSGLPVVSTRVGAEGLCLVPGQHLDVVEEAEDMIGALVHCLRSPMRAEAMANLGRQIVAERYDWDVLAEKLERVWSECAQRGAR
jgi:glycosyltransferase involved in cell wall biosynthesis